MRHATLLKASETKEHFYDLIDKEVTFKNDVMNFSGSITYHAGERTYISDVLYRDGFYSARTERDDIFWAKRGMSQDRFDALWDYCHKNWGDKKLTIIEHDGLYEDGSPKNQICIGIEEEGNPELLKQPTP